MIAMKEGALIEQVFSATQLIVYQQGSIVSREILSKDSGTVTLFAFNEGQGLSEHIAPFDALVMVLEGEAEITVAGAPHQVKAGEIIIMPANKPHALRAGKPFKMLLVMLRE